MSSLPHPKNCLLCGDVQAIVRLKQMDTSVFQCSQCGLVFIYPLPTAKELSALYLGYDLDLGDKDFPSHLVSRKNWRLPVFQEILDELAQYKSQGRLLEIGCSFGFFLSMVKERGFDPYGVDLSLNAVRYAAQTLRLPVRHGTVFDAKFPEEFFDITVMLGVFEHLLDPLETLGEVFRILRKEGVLIVEVPNANFNLLRGKISPSLFYIGNHVLNFTPKALNGMLERSGFRCVKIWCGKADHPRGWLFNLVKSSYVNTTRLLNRTLGCYWAPSLIALAIKSGAEDGSPQRD